MRREKSLEKSLVQDWTRNDTGSIWSGTLSLRNFQVTGILDSTVHPTVQHRDRTTQRRERERERKRERGVTHQKLAAAEALLRPVGCDGQIGHDRRGEASPRLMVTVVLPVDPLGPVPVVLVQLRRPYLFLSLWRLADGPMLREPRDPLGLHPVVVRPWLSSDRLQRLHGVEPRETILHGRRPQMIRQILRSPLRFHGLPIRRGTQTRSGRRVGKDSSIGVLRVLDVRGVEVAVAWLQRPIVLVQVQRRSDTGRRGRGAKKLRLVRGRPYLVRDRRVDPGGSCRSSGRGGVVIYRYCYFAKQEYSVMEPKGRSCWLHHGVLLLS